MIAEVKDELDDPRSSGSNNPKRMHMSHDIVPPLLLFLGSGLKLLPVQMLQIKIPPPARNEGRREKKPSIH